ncbi:MAG: DUF418 domain-containing protein [Verrucomicrobiae bacterium]|nr:DUF418 domain-containing protein [Verrucomicrobiae bacterium]
MPQQSPDRVVLIDALRGFALLAIAMVHFMEQFLANMAPPEHESYTRHWAGDTVLEVLFVVLVRGKGFALFSFMFGLSFALQMGRAQQKVPGTDPRWRFAWRLAVLLGIGFVHSLVYRGDILMIYALLGFPLLLFRDVPSRALWATALVLVAGLPRLLMALAASGSPAAAAEDAAAVLTYWTTLESGSWRELFALNATEGLRGRFGFQFGPVSRAYQTFALFLIGLWAGRLRLFEVPEAHAAIFKRLLRWCGGLTVALPLVVGGGFLVVRLLGTGESGESPSGDASARLLSPIGLAGMGLYDLWNFVMTLFYAALFVRVFQTDTGRRLLMPFAPVGRMALTCYLTQSLAGAFLFYGAGLGLLGRVGNSVALLLGVAVFGLQMLVCRVWLQYFRYGPVEWLWRSLTLLRFQPMGFGGAAVR